jgi:hypothetical protein
MMAHLEKQLAEQRLKTAGYVVYPGGPLCGNCQYVEKGGFCNHPAVQAHVDEVNGCCNLWEPREKHGPREGDGRDD